MDKKTIKQRSMEISDWLRDIRRDFHMHPELGQKEFRTQSKIKEYLDEMKVEYKTYEDSTCVVGLIKGAQQGKTVAIRADMDALPINERHNLLYRSKNEGVMHACGHDAHTTVLLGAARILNDMKSELNGNIKLLFQPAEETTGGAADMVKLGAMKDPEVDYVIGLHVVPEIPCGTIETKAGILNAASDMVHIEVKGKKAHGAYPEKGVDAIAISSNIVSALQTIISRNISPMDSAVFSIGTIKGGFACNIICDHVEMSAILRTLDSKVREKLKDKIKEVTEGIGSSLGGRAKVNITKGYKALINNKDVTDVILNSAKDMLGEDRVILKETPNLGVEDFSFFAETCKGAFYHLGCGNKEKGITAPAHSENFNIDEDCLSIGVMMHVYIALNLLNK